MLTVLLAFVGDMSWSAVDCGCAGCVRESCAVCLCLFTCSCLCSDLCRLAGILDTLQEHHAQA